MADPKNWTCQACGFVGLSDDSDGYFYCDRCGAQAEDLPTYLQYCKDVVFAVLNPLFEDHDEKLIEEFWDFYQNEKVLFLSVHASCNSLVRFSASSNIVLHLYFLSLQKVEKDSEPSEDFEEGHRALTRRD